MSLTYLDGRSGAERLVANLVGAPVAKFFKIVGVGLCLIAMSTGTATASTLTFDPAFQTLFAAGNSLARERQIQLAVRFEF